MTGLIPQDNLLGRRKPHPNSLTERPVNRPPALSSAKTPRARNSSLHSEESLQHPIRQPLNAPQSNLAQANAGFAQFLKEHTSPRHHRVTAGGRIVPMANDIPIPEFRPLPKKQDDDDPQKPAGLAVDGNGKRRNTASGSSSQDTSANANLPGWSNDFPSATQVRLETVPVAGCIGSDETAIHTSSVSQHLGQYSIPGLVLPFYCQQPAPLSTSIHPFFHLSQAFPEPVPLPVNIPQQYTGTEPVTWFPTLPQATIPPGYLQNPQPLSNPFSAAINSSFHFGRNSGRLVAQTRVADPPYAVSPTYPFANNSGSLTSFAAAPSMPFSLSSPGTLRDPATQRSLQDVTKEYESLSSQLANLDRYMAVHTFELDASTKDTLVEQRKGLVGDLDTARRYKEHLESGLKLASASMEPTPALRQQSDAFQPHAGDFATKFGTSGNPWMSSMATPNPLVDMQASTVTAGQDGFAAGIPLQYRALGSLQSFSPGSGWTDYSYGGNVPYVSNGSGQEYVTPMDVLGHGPDMPLPSGNQAIHFTHTAAPKSNLATIPLAAPPEINHLYRRIEGAVQRGEAVDGLFDELTKITEQHILQRYNHGQYYQEGTAEHLTTTEIGNGEDDKTHPILFRSVNNEQTHRDLHHDRPRENKEVSLPNSWDTANEE
jgi:hypothetical protein